ncbi:MAG: DNA repair protein RadC [Bacillota bacterium]|nr:DNA repair protein RadC [Bacillota bacterium]
MGRIIDMPPEERPREKACLHGVEKLRDAELLAILIGSGVRGKSALDIAEELLREYTGLSSLSRAPYLSIREMLGLKGAKALSLSAAFELGRRISRNEYMEQVGPYAPSSLYLRFKDELSRDNRESLSLLMLGKRNEILKKKKIYQGVGDRLLYKSGDVITELLINYASSFVVVHNHPSGNPLPSEEDVERTLELARQSKELGIRMLDHLIIGHDDYYSFRECRLL